VCRRRFPVNEAGRISAGAVDGFDGLSEVVGSRVSGGDDVIAGLDVNGAVAAGGLDEPAGGPAGRVLDPAADGQGREDDAQLAADLR
jgi:hypothetical protein